MATEPIQAGPYPVPGDPPDGPNQMSAITTWAAGRLNMRFSSTTTRDAAIPSPVEGMEAVTGTGTALAKWIYMAGAWVDITRSAWQDWTPVSAYNLGFGTSPTVVGRVRIEAKMVDAYFEVTLGTSPVVGVADVARIVLPYAARAGQVTIPVGQVTYTDTGVATYLGMASIEPGDANFGLYLSSATMTRVSSTTPLTFAVGDVIRGRISYEAA